MEKADVCGILLALYYGTIIFMPVDKQTGNNDKIACTLYIKKRLKDKRKKAADSLGISENAFTSVCIAEKIQRMELNNEEHF